METVSINIKDLVSAEVSKQLVIVNKEMQALRDENEKLKRDIKYWVNNDFTDSFSEMVQKWVCEDFAPEVQKWVCDQVIPDIQNWVKEYVDSVKSLEDKTCNTAKPSKEFNTSISRKTYL